MSAPEPEAGLPRLAPPRRVAARLATEDEAYIRWHYVPLVDLARRRGVDVDRIRRLMSERRLPQPAYILDDGTEMVARDHLNLLEEAGRVEDLESRFKSRYRITVEGLGRKIDDRDLDAPWKDYLSGAYGVCLWRVTPENIARKDVLVDDLDRRLSRPRPDDRAWRAAVRGDIEDLDRLERPGAPLDDARWGRRSSRSRLIEDSRQRYPWLFD
jgi:hypothetical protein